MFRMMRVLDLRTMRLKNFWMITRFQTTIRKLRSGTMVIISETLIFTVLGMLSGIVKACVQIRTQCQKISGRIQAAMPLCADL